MFFRSENIKSAVDEKKNIWESPDIETHLQE